jgi:hypothetical protein
MHRLLLDGAERTPDKLALHWVDRDVALTYAQAAIAMEHMAGALASLGRRAPVATPPSPTPHSARNPSNAARSLAALIADVDRYPAP